MECWMDGLVDEWSVGWMDYWMNGVMESWSPVVIPTCFKWESSARPCLIAHQCFPSHNKSIRSIPKTMVIAFTSFIGLTSAVFTSTLLAQIPAERRYDPNRVVLNAL